MVSEMVHPLANALVVVNPTPEFAPGGECPVPHGDLVMAHIARFVEEHEDEYILVVAMTDFVGPYHSNIDVAFDWRFTGHDAEKMVGFLDHHRIGHLDIVGLPLEGAVSETAIQCVKLGYDVSILTTMCAGQGRVTSNQTIELLLAVGVHVDGWWG